MTKNDRSTKLYSPRSSRRAPAWPVALLILTLHLAAAGLSAQDFNAACDGFALDSFDANNPAATLPIAGFPVPYLPAGPVPGSGWGAWFLAGPELQLADFDQLDSAAGFSMAYAPPAMGAPFDPFSVRLMSPLLQPGGIVIWRFRATWEFRVNGFGTTSADYEQMRFGLAGTKSQLGCSPGSAGTGLEFLGFSTRVQTMVCDTPPCPPAAERSAFVLGQLPAAISPLQVFAENNTEELGAELFMGVPFTAPVVHDFEVILDLDLGVFHVFMGRNGGPLVDVGGYRMVEDVGCGGTALPSRFLDLVAVAFDGHGLDNAGGLPPTFDAFRMDDLKIEHYNDTTTQSCGDVNGNDVVDIVDALLIAQQSGGLRSDPLIARLGDVNRDGSVLVDDTLRTALFLNGEDLPLLCPYSPAMPPTCP